MGVVGFLWVLSGCHASVGAVLYGFVWVFVWVSSGMWVLAGCCLWFL